MPSNQTANYQLNQWSRDDRVLMDDFNADNAKIDGAIKAVDQRADGLEETLTEHTAQIAKLGNCGVYVGSYIGTGNGQPTVANVPGRPLVLYVQDGEVSLAILSLRGMDTAYTIIGADYRYALVWEERSVSWCHGTRQTYSLNYKDHPYFYMVLYAMDE